MRLYHYRNIDSALIEIQDGTFHFASREELNDPVEGHLHVFWQGDKPAWQGLLRNFICSLYNALGFYLIQADEESIIHKTVMIDVHQSDDKPIGREFQYVGDQFLADKEIDGIAALYGDNNLRVEEKELRMILTFIHQKAFDLCIRRMKDQQLIPVEIADDILSKRTTKRIEFPHEIMQAGLPDEKHRKMIASSAEEAMEDIIEMSYLDIGSIEEHFLLGEKEYILDEGRARRLWMMISVDFPKLYVSQLEDMLYPEAYTVCFSAKDNDSAMWGNYADNHKGVCLVYETDEENQIRVAGQMNVAKSIDYDASIIKRNFFETFGRLTYKQIKSWLTGTEGVSKDLEAFSDRKAWREAYWAAFNAKSYQKLKAWKHEEEYRIVISNYLQEYNDPKSRNLQFDMKSLKGVIFGIKTSEYDKKQIVDALRKKRDKLGDIKFYQAEFDDDEQAIKTREKKMWKFGGATE